MANIDLRLRFVAAALIGLATYWTWFEDTSDPSSPALRWMQLADTDESGFISAEEYSRVSDGITPMAILDGDSDQRIDMIELDAFFRSADPVVWFHP
jgi:hypothetical protein